MSKTAFYNAKVYVEKGVYAEAILQEDGWIKEPKYCFADNENAD